MSIDDPGWDENSRVIRLIGDRLVQARWANSILTNNNGMAIDWTEDGEIKFEQLRNLLNELQFDTFEYDDCVALRAIFKLL